MPSFSPILLENATHFEIVEEYKNYQIIIYRNQNFWEFLRRPLPSRSIIEYSYIMDNDGDEIEVYHPAYEENYWGTRTKFSERITKRKELSTIGSDEFYQDIDFLKEYFAGLWQPKKD